MMLLRLFVENLLPILLVAGAGYWVAAALRIEARPLGALAFNLFAPCLIFQTLVNSHVPAEAVMRIGAFTVVVMTIPATIAFAIARWRKWSRATTSAIVLCSLVPNVGNYGLSANLLAFGEDALAYASVFFVAASVIVNTVGVLIASLGRTGWRSALLGLVRVPSVWAMIAALALRMVGGSLPTAVTRAIDLAASACIPLLLIVLGMQLRGAHLRSAAPPMFLASGLRLLGGMAAGLVCAPWFGLAGAARQAAIFESSMPTAVIASILANEYDVEPALVASVILLTTLLSPLTLTPLLAALR